jgi:hypothetical protein
MARTFPTAAIWQSQTSARTVRGGSPEFKALDSAFLAYAEARTTKGSSGQSIADEYAELKRAYDAYMTKKAANAGRLHLLGKVNRDGSGILQALGQFLTTTPSTGISPEEEQAMIDYTFQRTLRLRTALADARVELKPSSWRETFEAACTTIEKIRTKGLLRGNSLIEDLREQAARTEAAQARGSRGSQATALAQTAHEFYDAGTDAVSQVSSVFNGAPAAAPPPDTSTFEGYIANALQVTQDRVFDQMISAAQRVIGPDRYQEIVGLIPLLNTVVGAARVAKGLYDAVKAYQKYNECAAVRKTIIAPGDADTAFAALEKLLDEDFRRATQAAAEGAIAFAAGFDPTQTAGSVVGAATAVAHLFQDMIGFGLNYYQMVEANRILASWRTTPLDGQMSIAFGLKSTGRVRDEAKARRAGGAVEITGFTTAIRQCPLLGCYFIANMPALDVLEIVAADVAWNSQSSFFQMYLDIHSARVEKLVESARGILDNSRFRVTQNREQLHQLRSNLVSANLERHQAMHADRIATLTAFARQHEEKRQFREAREATLNAFVIKHVQAQRVAEEAYQRSIMDAAAVRMLQARQQAEDAAAAQLAELMQASATVERQRLIARRDGIARAIATYEKETSGIHRLHTVRNPESTEARSVLKGLIDKGTNLDALAALDAVASYLLTITARPREYPALRPLRDASRLKRLLQAEYDAAP